MGLLEDVLNQQDQRNQQSVLPPQLTAADLMRALAPQQAPQQNSAAMPQSPDQPGADSSGPVSHTASWTDPRNPGVPGAPPIAQISSSSSKGPGLLRRTLGSFLYYGGQAGLKDAGLPTDWEVANMQSQMDARKAQTIDTMAQSRQRDAQTAQMGQMVTIDGVTMPYGLALKAYPARIAALGHTEAAKIGAQAKVDVAHINQGQGVPVDETIANLVGMPEVAGQPAGKALWANINSALKSHGYQYKDLGNDGMWLMDRAGNKLKRIADSPMMAMANARGQSFAKAKAEWTPFETFDSEGNLTTTSAANAIQSGAPKASAWQSLYGPTSSTKTAGQAAGAVTSHIPELRQQISTLGQRGDLGPVMGRISEYMNSGYGGNDPLIANFVANMKLMNSGTVRAHFGARGGAQVLDQFNRILNTAQEPAAINGALNGIESWLNKYGDIGTAKGPKTNIPAAAKKQMEATGASLPEAAAAQLQEGHNTTFGNGQTWTKQNGKAVRVK